MSNSLDSFLTRIGDVTIERVGPRSSTRNSNNSGGNDDIMMTSSGSNHGLHGGNDDDSDDTGGDCSDNELEKRRIMMHCNERDDINSEGSGDDMDLDDTIDTEIGVRMDSERQNSVSSCQDDDVDAVNILDTLPLEGAPIEGQEVSEADLLGKPLKDDDSESVNSNPGHSDPEDENDPSKRRDSDDSDPAKKKQKKEDDDMESKAEKKLSNMRRNIREVMDETQLDEATLSAQRQEMERLRRVQEQQRIIREVQRQIANHRQSNRGQSRVISLLQGKQNEIGTTLSHSPSGSSQIKSPNQLLMNMNSPSQQSSSMTQPGASRRPMSGMRWQKGRGGYQGQTMMSKVMNRAPTQNVLQQRIRMMTPSVSISPVVPKREPMDDLPPYYSDSDLSETEAEEIEKDIHCKFPMPKSPKPLKGKDVVTISSSSESSDDDCIVLSDPSGGEETDTEDDPSNSGMHTNDRYNIPDEHGRVLINVGHPDTEPDVFLAPQVSRIIKPHQIGGLRFLFDNIVESIERYKSSSGFGCILAHSMGLGKTLQVTSFCDIFFRCTTAKTVLCIMPINTLQNWLAEFNMWLPYEDPDSVKPPEVPKKPEFDQKQDIKEENSNQTDISSLSSRSMSTDSRSHQEMPQHMGNMMGGGVGGFPHQSYENPGMGNFYPEMMNKPGMEQNYHQMYPNMPVPNYPAMKQELDCGDGSTKPTPPIPYGTDNPGAQYPGQMYPGMDNRSMYPGMNPQNPSYPRYQNPQYPNYPQQMPQDHIKSENKPEMGIKKEPEEPATKDEGTSTSKDETSEEKKDVEKITTPFSVDAPIGVELRPRHFRLHILNDSHKTMAARARVIKEWQKVGGVLLIGYELYRQLSLKKPNKGKRKRGQPFKDTVDVEEEDKNKGLLDEMHGALVNPGPDLVICDEGHRIKNSHASISLALKQMRTKRRIVLTGYPLQNNLLEYWCMVDFVRPNYLGTKAEFCNMFERPIQNGQCIDSTPQDIRLMRYRAHVLHALLEGFVQRRSHSVLQVSLPRKEEYIMLVRMTPHQRKLYDTFMNQVVKTRAVPNPLKAFAVCCKIWNHPDILYHFLRKRQANEEDDLDLEETIEKATPGNKRTKPRGRGEKRGRKVGTIKNKPAASVQPNSLSTGANENDNDTTGDTKSGNFPNFTQQIQPPNFPNSGQNYPQNYQEFRPNEPNNYYRNESTTGFNELYNSNNNGNQQRFPNQQFPSYPQGSTNYSQQNYQQNQNQNFPPGEQSTQNTQQKYTNPQNPEFRGDQSNNTNYEMPGIFPRQSYNFQEQRNFQAPPNQPGNQQNYQNQIPNQSNVPISEFPNYPHNPPHNYPQTSANNPMFRSENQINPHSFPAGQNQNQPQNPTAAPSTGFINNQTTPAGHQAPAPLLPNAYPPSQQTPSSNFSQTPPTQGQIFQQNPQSQQNQQQHNYQSNNQSQMRSFQTPQAPFPAAQGHGFSSERQPYPAGQSCPPAGSAQQQSYPGNQGQRYPGPQQNYNQNQNGPPNPPGNYGNSQTPMQNYPADGNQPNQFKGQEERFGWQGNYQQQVPEQWDQSQGNRYQGNYFNAQNYPQNFDYSGNPGEVTIKTEDNKGAPPPQPNMLRGPNPITNYDSKKDVSVGIQSQPMPPANYVQPTSDGVPNPPRPLQNMNFNRNNAADLPKDEDKDKDEILVEKDKEDKSDDEVLLKDEEKDPKNSPNFKEDPGIPYDWATDLMKGYVPGLIDASAKMTLFFCILEEAIRLGDRVLAFSQSLFTLNLIEDFLARNDFKNPDGTTEQWMKNVNYYRLDGSTSALEREKLINEFNHNSRIHLFLVSTRAGSLGINLVGANRAIVFDASWNPCHDTQAVCRVYRYGQKKPCYVYRLVTDNCLERKIYDRQISKQGMADRVVDQCNPDAHLSLKEATTLSWDFEEDSQVQDFSSSKDSYTDEVMHTVLEKHSSLLTKQPFHHESLLVDRKDKKLSQAEKRLARRGYELEKMAANCSRPSYNYIPGNTATRAGGLQIRAIRGGDTGVAPKPVASVRPMQQRGAEGLGARGVVGSRWIPAEVWQRQGMSAQEMTLPLDVVIPTNSPDKSSIVLKAGQRVMVLKSPKGIYMQLESGKIIAIRTALKINQQKREEEPKKPATVTSPRATQKPDVSFPLRSNSAISIIPKTTATSAPPTPRPLSRPSSGSGYRQFPDKDPKRPKPVLPTPLSKGSMALPLTNQVTLQRHSRGKNEMDHSSAGENSNSSDSQPRIDQRVEEVRLEDIVGDGGGSNSDYSPTNSNRIPNNDVMSEDKSHDFGSDPMSSQKVIMQSVQTQHTETEPVEMLVTDGKERLGQAEMKDQLRPGTYGHRYPTQVIKDDSDEIIIEEPVRPIVQHQPLQHPQQQQQSIPTQVIPRPPEMPKLPVPVDQQHPTASVKERQAPSDASDGPEHGIPQAYPYAQYPRYYDYPDPRSRGLPAAAPYGSYYPGGPAKAQPEVPKTEERSNYPQAASAGAPAPTVTTQVTQPVPAPAEPVEPVVKTENLPPTTTASVPTAFTHPPGSRYPGSYPPAPYDPYSQHYPAAPATNPAYPPSGTPGYGAYGGPSYNTDYARMYSAFHGPPPPVADPYMHRGYAPPPTTHTSNYYAPFPHPPPPPYPNYSFIPPYSNPNIPNESQPPAQ